MTRGRSVPPDAGTRGDDLAVAKNIGLLFETTPENVLTHLKNIFAENELPEAATAKEYLAVQTEGKRQVQRSILHYSSAKVRALYSAPVNHE
jgi:hypothetical protein